MLKQKTDDEHDSTELNHAPGVPDRPQATSVVAIIGFGATPCPGFIRNS